MSLDRHSPVPRSPPTTVHVTAGSRARSTGCSSIWARMITTTSSIPRSDSGSPCRGSSESQCVPEADALIFKPGIGHARHTQTVVRRATSC
jgi:hypothetical protein